MPAAVYRRRRDDRPAPAPASVVPAAPLSMMAPADRPREKLLRAGAGALGDNELLAVLIGSGIRNRDALVVAALLLGSGGLTALTRLAPARLTRTPGVGPGRAARILAAFELGRRALAGPRVTRPRLTSAATVADYLRPEHGSHPEERFGVLLLDTRHRAIGAVTISRGTLDASLVHPREVFRAATEHAAAAVVLFHNHPSGDPSPSVEDVQLTRRLVEAGELMGIAVLDHIVLGDGCWHGLRDSMPALFRR